MTKVAIAIDDWKLDIFKKYLDSGGYSYEQYPGMTDEMLILKVETDNMIKLYDLTKAAQFECAQSKGKRP